MILRVLAVSMIGFTLAGCVSSSGLSGDVYSASEAKQVQSVTYGTIVHTRAVQIQGGDDSNAIGAIGGAVLGGFILGFTEVVAVALFPELGGYKDAFAFMFLILVLLFRPVGIMGDERLERSRF